MPVIHGTVPWRSAGHNSRMGDLATRTIYALLLTIQGPDPEIALLETKADAHGY
jgi:hypothetical protein